MASGPVEHGGLTGSYSAGARHRANARAPKFGKQLAAQDLDDRRKDLARAAMQTLTDRMRPVNDALRAAYPHTQIDVQHDQIAENLLSSKHLHWGVTSDSTCGVEADHEDLGDSHSPFSCSPAPASCDTPHAQL